MQVIEKHTEVEAPAPLSPDEMERTLIDRIKSIKQEKWAEIFFIYLFEWNALIKSLETISCFIIFRVDLACRLHDLEQEQSDNDNLDSSSSMSSESLDDRLGSLDSEGQ